MKNTNTFNESKFHILQIAEKKLNRKLFCDLHGISASTLSRILSGKQEVTFEILDYICQEIEIKPEIYL
jgi:DNA-binding Xre family transcriptional regulator